MGRARIDVLFLGYFGFGNLGDELILGVLAERVRQQVPDARLAALSGPLGLGEGAARLTHAIPRSERLAVRVALASARVLCVGPGGIFQDATSLRSCAWYGLQTWRAARVRAGVVHVGQSLGPLRSRVGRYLARQALRRGQQVVVRDAPSVRVAAELGVVAQEGADLAWLLPGCEHAPAWDRQRVGLAPRGWPGARTDAAWWARLRDGIEASGFEPLWLLMSPDDARLAEEAERLTVRRRAVGPPLESGPEAMAAMGGCRAVVGMRLHALLLACLAGAEPIGLSYDPKIDGMLSGVGREPLCTVMEPCAPHDVAARLGARPEPVAQAAIAEQRALASKSVEAVLNALSAARRDPS